jgi:hypothetical protein
MAEFREALDRIKADFSEQLQHETADKEEFTKRVDELGRDIEFLKQCLESVTKRRWGEMLVVRLSKWRDKFSLRQIAAGTRVLNKLLPTGLSVELDAVAEVVDGVADVIEKTSSDQ